MGLTYDEIKDVLDIKFFPSGRTRDTLAAGIYEISDINKTLEHSLPNSVKVNITIDDISLKSNFKITQTLIFTEKSFFNTILGFTLSHL